MLGVLLVAGGVLFAQGIGPAPQPAPITVRNEITVQAPPPDPQAIADASITSVQAIVVQLAAPTLVKWVNDLLNIPDIFRTTPPDLTYNNGGVRGVADQVRTVALALAGLAIFAVGMAYALGQRPSFGRLIFGIVLAIGNLAFWEIGIGLNNAINNAIAAPDVKSIVSPHLTLPGLTANPVDAFGPAVLVIVYAVVLLLLLLSLAFRLGLIDILIAVGSLGLFCKTTEQTDAFYSRYVTLSVSTLFSQVLIVVALKLAPIIGGLGAGVAGTLLGIVILLLARRMPALLRSAANQSRGTMLPLLLLRRAVLRH